jgi:hypothetical protein
MGGERRNGTNPVRAYTDCFAAVATVFRRQNEFLHERVVVALGPAIVSVWLQEQQLFRGQSRFLVGFVQVGPIRAQLVAPVLGHIIAFHGSWDRAPYAQGGYNVVFQPLDGNRASGQCEIFADGFAGAVKSPGKAEHRPSGLAVGPDGSLYVSDDIRGGIYRIVYVGGSEAAEHHGMSDRNSAGWQSRGSGRATARGHASKRRCGREQSSRP